MSGLSPAWPRRLAWLCAAFALGALLSDWTWRLPLAAAGDEQLLLDQMQGWREGWPLDLGLGRGWIYLNALAALAHGLGRGVWGLRLPTLLGLALEGALLWRQARRLGGEAAAAGALAAHLLSRLTLARASVVMNFNSTPLFILLTLELVAQSRRWSTDLAAGFAGAWLLSDYEGALPAFPAVALAAAQDGGRGRGRWLTLSAGLALGLALRLWLSRADASHYWQVRSQGLDAGPGPLLGAWASRLGAFCFGTGKVALLGERAALQGWAWPLALAGLGALPWAWKSALLLGLAALALPSEGAAEANRALAAWPAWCLACGLGLSRLSGAWQGGGAWRRGAALAASLWLAAGGLWQAATLRQERLRSEVDRLDLPLRHWRLARFLKERGGRLVSELSYRSNAPFRYLAPPAAGPEPLWVLLSAEQAPFPEAAAWGRWKSVANAPGREPLHLLAPREGDGSAWLEREARVKAFLARGGGSLGYQWPQQRDWLAQALSQGVADPWLRQTMVDRLIYLMLALRRNPPELVDLILAQPSPSSRHRLAAALFLSGSDPRRALDLVEGVLAREPGRAGAWRLKREIEAALASRPRSTSSPSGSARSRP